MSARSKPGGSCALAFRGACLEAEFGLRKGPQKSPCRRAAGRGCSVVDREAGPEVVYRFVTTAPGDFFAELIDPIGVDIGRPFIEE